MATFSTERLKELTSYAVQGAGFDKLLDISGYMGIRIEDGMIYLNTTDGTTYLSVSDECDADDMDITVDAELFSKLIGKINSNTITMSVIDNTKLEINGNGRYTLALQQNESGDTLSFPDKFPKSASDIGNITAHDLATIASSVKASLSGVKGSDYSNYYFGDIVVGTDKAMMSIFNRAVFKEPCLIDRNVVDIMLASGKDVTIAKSENNMLIFESSISDKGMISLCTPVKSIGDFKVDAIRKFAELDVKSFCRFKKAYMLDLLDRLSLFVDKFEDGAIELHFTDSYVDVSSMSSSGIERIEYTESKDAEDITIKINIDRFRNQLKAYGSDVVDLYYGNQICIKLVDGDMTQIIALMLQKQ